MDKKDSVVVQGSVSMWEVLNRIQASIYVPLISFAKKKFWTAKDRD